MLEGQTEFSIIKYSELESIKLRIDSEFYQQKYLRIEEQLNTNNTDSLGIIGAELDCSAFYPSITDSYRFNGNGAPFLRVNEIQSGLVKATDKTAFLPQTILDENDTTIRTAQPFDIVIAKGGNTLAKLGLLPADFEQYALSRDLIVLRTSQLKKNKYFIWQFLHSAIGQTLLWRTASQTGQPHLTLPAILNIPIPSFSLEFESQAEFLYKDSQRLKALSIQTQKQAENVLLEALGLSDWQPPNPTSYERSSKDVFSRSRLDAEHYHEKNYALLDHIKSLDVECLTINQIVSDMKNGAEVRSYQADGIPYLRVKDIKNYTVDDSTVAYVDPELAVDELEKVPLSVGDVLVSRSGSLAVTGVVEKEWSHSLISSHLIQLKLSDKRIDAHYLALFLSALPGKMQIQQWSNGGVQPEINQPSLGAVVVPCIDKQTQMKIKQSILIARQQRERAAELLEAAKRSVEIAIEESEDKAMQYLKQHIEA